jgi:hypothetical protein
VKWATIEVRRAAVSEVPKREGSMAGVSAGETGWFRNHARWNNGGATGVSAR